jgi:hypothetical protein
MKWEVKFAEGVILLRLRQNVEWFFALDGGSLLHGGFDRLNHRDALDGGSLPHGGFVRLNHRCGL